MRGIALVCVLVIIVSGLCQVITARKPKMTPTKDELVIQEGDELKIQCQGEGRLEFSMQNNTYHPSGSKFETLLDEKSHTYTFVINRTKKENTGWYACAKEGIRIKNDENNIDHESDDIAWIYVYVNSSEPFAIDANFDHITAVAGSTLVVPCRPTSPNVSVRLEVNWNPTEMPENMEYYPKIGFIVPEIGIERSGQSFECSADGPKAKTASFTLHVAAPAILDNPKVNLDRIRHVVWGRNMTVECNITVPHNTKFVMSWKVPASIPKERWSFSPQPESVSSESSGMTWKSELTVKNVEPSDGGEYACVVDHLENELETRELVRIWDPDNTYINATVEGNYSITPSLGEDHAQWKIEIDAYPENFTWKWLKPNGQEITREDLDDKIKYSHSNENLWHFFVVSKLNVEDNGNYTLKLSNVARQITIALQLTVPAKPSVLLDEVQPFYSLGKLATFSCQTTGQPSPNITWIIKEYPDVSSKENFELKYPSNVTTKQGPKGPYQSVSTLQVIINQTGEVTCRSCNEINCVDITEQIFVSDVSEHFGIVDPGLVVEGDDIDVTCGATAYNFTETITWIPEDSEKQEFNTSRIYPIKRKSNFTSQSILAIRKVRISDTGNYICQAVTKQGSIEKKVFQLFVSAAVAPIFRKKSMENSKITVDLRNETEKSVVMMCYAEGMPIPKMTWYKDDELLVESNKYKFLDDNRELRITYFREEDSGRYRCEATNRVGTAERHMDIEVKGKSNMFLIGTISVFVIVIVVVVVYMGIRLHREKVLRRKLLDIAVELEEDAAGRTPIDEEADLLSHDKRIDFLRKQVSSAR